MNRGLVLAGALLLALLLAGAALLLLAPASPSAAPPPRASAPAPRPAPTAPAEADPAPPVPEEPAAPPSEDELPPGEYPWRVPAWWRETERRLADARLEIAPGQLAFPDILDRVGAAAGVEVRLGPELEEWGRDRLYSLAKVDGNALAFVDLLASVHNLEVVLGSDGAVLHQRGRAPDTPVVRSGRVQWTLRVARERRALLRDADPAEHDLLRAPFAWNMEGGVEPDSTYPARDLAVALGRTLGVPVYLDERLWTDNPSANVGGGEATVGDVLGRVAERLGARFEATPRRVALFRP